MPDKKLISVRIWDIIVPPLPGVKLDKAIVILQDNGSMKYAIPIDKQAGLNLRRYFSGSSFAERMPFLDLLVSLIRKMHQPLEMVLRGDSWDDIFFELRFQNLVFSETLKLTEGFYLTACLMGWSNDFFLVITERAAESAIIDKKMMSGPIGSAIKAWNLEAKRNSRDFDNISMIGR